MNLSALLRLSLPAIALLSASRLGSQDLKPTDRLALLSGTVTNFAGKPLAGETIIFENERTRSTVKAHTDISGRFKLLVPNAATYQVLYKNFTADMPYTQMKIPESREASYEVRIKIDPPKEFVLENIHFDTGKSILKPSSNKTLNDLAEVLKLKPQMEIELQGHTDNEGNPEYNLKLSQARADAVRAYLISKGIAAKRVKAVGYGASMPVADNSNAEGRAQNRRTSLKVLKE